MEEGCLSFFCDQSVHTVLKTLATVDPSSWLGKQHFWPRSWTVWKQNLFVHCNHKINKIYLYIVIIKLTKFIYTL